MKKQKSTLIDNWIAWWYWHPIRKLEFLFLLFRFAVSMNFIFHSLICTIFAPLKLRCVHCTHENLAGLSFSTHFYKWKLILSSLVFCRFLHPFCANGFALWSNWQHWVYNLLQLFCELLLWRYMRSLLVIVLLLLLCLFLVRPKCFLLN